LWKAGQTELDPAINERMLGIAENFLIIARDSA
jgi:hypothetical protein